jgi:hypothetical protein
MLRTGMDEAVHHHRLGQQASPPGETALRQLLVDSETVVKGEPDMDRTGLAKLFRLDFVDLDGDDFSSGELKLSLPRLDDNGFGFGVETFDSLLPDQGVLDFASQLEPLFAGPRGEIAEGADSFLTRPFGGGDRLDQKVVHILLLGSLLGGLADVHRSLCIIDHP